MTTLAAAARRQSSARAAALPEGVAARDVATECLRHTAEREQAGIASVLVGQVFMLVVHWGQPTLQWVLAAVALRLGVLAHQLWLLRRITAIGAEQALSKGLNRRLVWGLGIGGSAWGLLAWAIGPLGHWTLRDELTVMLLLVSAPLTLITTSYLWQGMLAFNVGLWSQVVLRVASEGRGDNTHLVLASLAFLMVVLYLYGRQMHQQTLRGLVAHLHTQHLRRELAQANQQLVLTLDQALALATRDPLTQVLNRRAFLARASAEASAMSRHGQSACVLMLDLDRFKAINDVHGHAVGDSVLVAVANAIQTQLRGADVLARWGGEEFIVLLPSTSPIDALGVAERVRAALPALTQPHWPADVRTSTSIGLTAWASGQDIDHAIRQADTALYRAKAEGRNRVCQAPPVA